MRLSRPLEAPPSQLPVISKPTAFSTTHPRVILRAPAPHDAELNGFLDWVYTEVDFKRWFFGHLPMDEQLNDQMPSCFEAIHPLEL